jgi:asparagine synthase (glutamine-hydrolysing)
MCGISGVLSESGGERFRNAVARMNAFQCLRGPDDEGIFCEGSVCFGHRRLSIIDLSEGGHQPMRRGDFVITFNGEIYNFLELKKELLESGVVFKTNSDTEVILALFERDGEESFARLRGMFAFALWDTKKETLYLVRDHFGIKPLYYAEKGGVLAFASTVGALRTSGVFEFTKNEDARIAFLIFGSIPAPLTSLRECQMLPDGCFLRFTKGKKEIVRYYSSLPAFAFSGAPTPAQKESVSDVLSDSISVHMISDAPLGVFLSGGLDSSVIAFLAAKGRETPLTTLSATFLEKDFSEEQYQHIVAERIRSEHQEKKVTREDFFKVLPDALSAMDEPTIDGVNTYCIAKVAKDAGLKVVLSGLGSDEIFLGYNHFRRAKLLRKIIAIPFAHFLAYFGGKYKKFAYIRAGNVLGFYLVFRGIFSPQEVAKMTGVSVSRVFQFLEELENKIFGDDLKILRTMDAVQLLSYLETKLYMQNQLLKDSDVMGMRHSIEIRVPFVDRRVIEFVARINPKEKLQGAHNKELLVNAVPTLPHEVYERSKMGFTFPFEMWLKESQEYHIGQREHWSKAWAKNIFERWNR